MEGLLDFLKEKGVGEVECVEQELPYDSLTPILVYQALGGEGCAMLESAHSEGEGKISLIGIQPIGTFKAVGREVEIDLKGEKRRYVADPYALLKEFSQGRKAFGFIGYNAIRLKEKIPDRHPPGSLPDFFFHLYQTVIIFYHDRQRVICCHEGSYPSLEVVIKRCLDPIHLRPFIRAKKVTMQSDIAEEEYMEMVEKAKAYIKAGDLFQIVLSRTLHTQMRAKPFEIYRALRQVSPSPYHFFFEEREFAIAGASPELMISVQDGVIESMPIAGTCPKEESGETLLQSPKECAEHVMLVDLARNDVGAIAVAGSVRVTDYMQVKSFSHVNHLISRVRGILAPSYHALDAFKASFPAGTLSGAPKIRAMEIIDELEQSRRELYGGAIVSLDEKGNLMSCIAIRTALIRDSKVEIRVGAGIVYDSESLKELEETAHKAKSVIEALKLVNSEERDDCSNR